MKISSLRNESILDEKKISLHPGHMEGLQSNFLQRFINQETCSDKPHKPQQTLRTKPPKLMMNVPNSHVR